MAPKKIYSNQRFAEIAAESAAKARGTYPNSLPMDLSCEHLPEFDKAFCHNDGKLRRDTPLTFRWRVKCAGYEATHDVNARCNNATERGVPLPEHWRTAMQCLTLDARADASTGDMRETGVSQVRCEVLGQARLLEPSRAESEEPETGKIIALRTGESRVVFFLCAHVHGNEWLCHRGSFVDGALAENPFQEKVIVSAIPSGVQARRSLCKFFAEHAPNEKQLVSARAERPMRHTKILAAHEAHEDCSRVVLMAASGTHEHRILY